MGDGFQRFSLAFVGKDPLPERGAVELPRRAAETPRQTCRQFLQAPAGPVRPTMRAARSASTMTMPWVASQSVRAVLPLPMPPVMPTRNISGAYELQVFGDQRVAKKERQQTGPGQIRAEGHGGVAALTLRDQDGNPERCANKRRQQNY